MPDDAVGIGTFREQAFFVIDEGHATGHAGTEILANSPQNDGHAAGHVFTAIGAAAFDDGQSPGIADSKTLARLAGGKQLSGGGTIEHGIADDGVLIAVELAGRHLAHHHGTAGEALADIVIGIAEHFELQPLDGEGAQRLAGRAAQPHRQMVGLQAGHAKTPGDLCREPGADRPEGIADIVLQLHLFAGIEERAGILDHLRIQCIRNLVATFQRAIARLIAGISLGQQRIEIEIVEIRCAAADLFQQFGATDDLVQGLEAERGQDFAHFLGNEAEEIDDLFRRAGEFRPQLLVLGANADRAGIGMALPHHDAAHGHQRGRADAEFLGAENGGDDNIAAGLDATIGAQPYPVAQTVERQHLVHFGKTHFPGDAGIFDAGMGRGAGATDMAGNQDDIGLGLGDPGGNGADAATRHQFHADFGGGIDLLQIIDQLGQILDRIDIVMRRRRDQ